jgi:hypothetical protein
MNDIEARVSCMRGVLVVGSSLAVLLYPAQAPTCRRLQRESVIRLNTR